MVELTGPADYKNLPEVTNPVTFSGDNPTPDGLYSEKIFGHGIKESAERFGYVNLKNIIIQPLIYDRLGIIDPLFKKVVDPNFDVLVEVRDGLLIESASGKRGISYLYNIWDHIDFKKYSKTTKNLMNLGAKFDTLPKNQVFTDKWIVIPPLYRPWVNDNGIKKEDEITGIYKELIRLTQVQKGQHSYTDMVLNQSNKQNLIQKKVNELHKYIMDIILRTTGIQEQKLIGKRIDNVSRLVANANPGMPLDSVGLPWHVLLGLFDTFVIAELTLSEDKERIHKELNIPESTGFEEYGQIFDHITRNVEIYVSAKGGDNRRLIWIEILKTVFDKYPELRVLLKRDPAWDKNSYHSLKPVIITDQSYHVVTNSLIYKPIGGDSFNTKICGMIKKTSSPSLIKKSVPEHKKEFRIEIPYKNKVRDSRNPKNDHYKVLLMKNISWYLKNSKVMGG